MASNKGQFLNQENIMKKVFDENNDALKVNVVSGSGSSSGLTDAELRASPVDVNVTNSAPTTVVIDAADDSIAIGDRTTGDLMTVNPDGTINANISGVTPISGRLPVDLGSASVNITGPVTISNEVEVKNDSGNPIPVTGTVVVTGVATAANQTTEISLLNTINNSINTVDADIQALGTQLTTINNEQLNQSSYLSQILTMDGIIKDEIQQTNSKLDDVKTKQDTTNSKLTSIDGKVATLAEQQTQTLLLNDLALPKTRTAVLTSTNTSGTVMPAQKVTFANIGSGPATVAGGTLPAGITVNFEANLNDVLSAIAYDATGTILLISTVV